MTRPSLMLAIIFAVLGTIGVSAADVGEAFTEASVSYENGDYEGAIAGYEAIVSEDIVDAHLFYNLANAYYKVGALGHAVLYYERARRLAPRDGDIAHNLGLARSLLRDSQFVSDRGRLRRGLTWVHNNLNTSESFALATILYMLLATTIVAFVFQRTGWVSGLYDRVSIISPGRLFGFQKSADLALAIGILLVLTSTVATSAWTKQSAEAHRAEAVIIGEEVSVFSGPNEDATLQFKVHEGTIVHVNDARTGWLKVELPGELSGWISATSAERI